MRVTTIYMLYTKTLRIKSADGASLTFDECEYTDGHDQDGDHEISDGQRHKEVVGDVLQPTLPRDGQAHKYVSSGRGQHQEHGQQGPPPVAAVERALAAAAADNHDTTTAANGDVWLADEERRRRRRGRLQQW